MSPRVKRYPSGPARIPRCFAFGKACGWLGHSTPDAWCGDNHPAEYCARRRVERQIHNMWLRRLGDMSSDRILRRLVRLSRNYTSANATDDTPADEALSELEMHLILAFDPRVGRSKIGLDLDRVHYLASLALVGPEAYD